MRMVSLRSSEGIASECRPAYNECVHVRVRFERTGGFAGRRVEVFVDSDSLPPTQAKRLQSLLAKSCFFDLPMELRSGPEGADRFQYRVTVETDSRSHTVKAGEAAIPESMRPLLDWLMRREA